MKTPQKQTKEKDYDIEEILFEDQDEIISLIGKDFVRNCERF